MFRDVKPTSDITLFTLGGSSNETSDVCKNYFGVSAFAYWICRESKRGQGRYLYKGLEVFLSVFSVSVCLCMKECAFVHMLGAFPFCSYRVR